MRVVDCQGDGHVLLKGLAGSSISVRVTVPVDVPTSTACAARMR
jgi:hypothetical protein